MKKNRRPLRGVTFLNDKAYKRRELLKNCAGGLVAGLFLVILLFIGYGVY